MGQSMLGGVGFAFCAFTGTKNFRISILGQKTGNFPAGGFTARRIQASTQNCGDSGWLIVGLAACMVPAACPTNLPDCCLPACLHAGLLGEGLLGRSCILAGLPGGQQTWLHIILPSLDGSLPDYLADCWAVCLLGLRSFRQDSLIEVAHPGCCNVPPSSSTGPF